MCPPGLAACPCEGWCGVTLLVPGPGVVLSRGLPSAPHCLFSLSLSHHLGIFLENHFMIPVVTSPALLGFLDSRP